jgi:flavin-dependent dehydrogenase
VPYGYRAVAGPAGLFRVGDQASVIPSFCGDGVAMALGSGRRAAEAVLSGQEAAWHHAAWGRAVAVQMRLAGVLSILVGRAPELLVAAAARAPWLAAWAARRTRTG